MSLSKKQRDFADHYFKTGDLVGAYKKAGFKGSRGNSLHLYGQAAQIKNNPSVKAYLEHKAKRFEDRIGRQMEREWLRTRDIRRRIVTADLADFLDFDTDGLPVPKRSKDIPKEKIVALKSIDFRYKGGEISSVRFELRDISPHLDDLEDKFAKMPDNEPLPQRVDITSGGKPLTARDNLLALMDKIKAKAALPAHYDKNLDEIIDVVPEKKEAK